MPATKSRGKQTRSSSSGLPLRELAAHASCMCCKSAGLASTGTWRSFGRSSLKLGKKKSRWRSCFRIKLGFARWTPQLIYSITTALSGHSKRRSHCGYQALRMVITPARLDSCSTNSCVASLGKRYRNIGAKFLHSRSISICIGLPEKENARVATVYAAKERQAARAEEILQRPDYAWHAGTQNVYVSVRTEFSQRDEHSRCPCATDCFVWRDWERFGTCEVLLHACEWRQTRRANFLLGRNNRVDDHNTVRRHGPRFSNTDGVFRRAHERSTKRDAKIVREVGYAFGHPGAGGSHGFADPENRISFAYVMNQMEQSLLPNEKSLRLVDAVYRTFET